MFVRLATLYEEGGRPLARHRAAAIQPSYEGFLWLHEEYDRDLRRSVRKARLLSPHGVEPLLSLYDAVVLFYGDGIMTITGMERDPLTRKATAQSWYIEVIEVGK